MWPAVTVATPGLADVHEAIVFVSSFEILSYVAVAPDVPPVINSPSVNAWAVSMFKCVNILISNKKCLYTADVKEPVANKLPVAVPELYS